MSTALTIVSRRPPKRMGRPSLFSPELAATIVARLAGGLSLRRLCRQKDMPSANTVLRWVGERADFREQYVRALEARGCSYGEQVVDIAHRVMAGELAPDVGRVAIDGLKWAASRMAPRVYGDRVALTGHDGGAVKHAHKLDVSKASDEQLDQLEKLVTAIGGGVADAGGDQGREGETQH